MRGQGHASWIAVLAVAALAASAVATPVIDSAIIKTRLWDDFPDSALTFGNNYPDWLWIQDAGLVKDDQPPDWANRHNFRLSENGGISEAVFMNDDAFAFAADVTISGTLNAEGGLSLSPWWSQDFDGVFMIRTDDGEVSCWGGRLPFYNFTAEYGVTYQPGTTVRLGMAYNPQDLTAEAPGIIRYFFQDADGTPYASPWLAFDMGNPDEDPPYGLWGILNDARVGGWFLPKGDYDPDNWSRIDFDNMMFIPEPTGLLLLGLATLLLRKR